MCGIVGGYKFKYREPFEEAQIKAALENLRQRGPDDEGVYTHEHVFFGQRRLSIIDTSKAGHQPMHDASGRYTLVFNGEIYNYQTLRKSLERKGVTFESHTDTEVVLYALIHGGREAVEGFNGFFAFAFYDRLQDRMLIMRDRLGIKPLYYHTSGEQFLFASEIKAITPFRPGFSLDTTALWTYFQLNYIPAPLTVYKQVKKLKPGHFIEIIKGEIKHGCYYTIPGTGKTNTAGPKRPDYSTAQSRLKVLLDDAVRQRLVADVPLGAFLSGGIDSSIITALAANHTQHLNTFSIGYKDDPFFDETKYAELVADKYNTNHTSFYLTRDDLFNHLFSVLDYLDEPFADSSALVVNILSRMTRQKVTVALSGDGADELFAGYHKYYGEWQARQGGLKKSVIGALLPVWKILPKSRDNALTNRFRQFHRFAEAVKMGPKERYWRWCGFLSKQAALNLLSDEIKAEIRDGMETEFENMQKGYTRFLNNPGNLNEVLMADTHLVLPDDMLTKVDRMSMANSLEVRVPFLDHRIVEFVFGLPSGYKINKNMKKRILQETFRDVLPEALFNRPKQGFEVPLLKWFRQDLSSYLEEKVIQKEFLMEQGIFNPEQVSRLYNQLHSKDPGDAHATIYALLVFQHWWGNNKLNGFMV
jgi:asparagine synthase (glutamine-hydrolysing)